MIKCYRQPRLVAERLERFLAATGRPGQ